MTTEVFYQGPGCVAANQCFVARITLRLGRRLQPGEDY